MKDSRYRKNKHKKYDPLVIATLIGMIVLLITVVVLRSGATERKETDPVTAGAEVTPTPPAAVPTEVPSTVLSKPVPELYDGIVSMELGEPAEINVSDNAVSENDLVAAPTVDRTFETNLPILYLSTDSGKAVTSRDVYAPGKLILDGKEYTLGIRGRGNTTWRYYPQKGYMLKLDESASLLGMINAEKYVLVSSYVDKTFIRNCVAMDIASCMDGLEYTPKQQLVDVYLNSKYIGVYTFSEKIEPGQDKIDLFADQGMPLSEPKDGDTPFLLETGIDLFNYNVKYGRDHFETPHSPRLRFIWPEFSTANTPEAKFIMDYMEQVDKAFVNKEGWEDLIDLDSWVDWFIVMELCVNTDSALWRSTFLYRQENGLLKIGPVWDFDMAMGNFSHDNKTYRYWSSAEQVYNLAQNHYMSYLYKDDDFMLAVRERWDEKKDELLQVAFDSIDRHTEEASLSRPQNDRVYGRSSKDSQALALKDFLQKRYDWIDESIHMDDFNRHAATYTLYDYHPQNAGNAEEVPPALPDAGVVPDADVIPMPDAGVVPVPDEGAAPMPETIPEAVTVE